MCNQNQGIGIFAVCLLALSLLLPATAWSYGGGGGSDVGGGIGGIGSTSPLTPWSKADLNAMLKNVTPDQRSIMVKAFSGSTISRRELLGLRQTFLEINSSNANVSAQMLDMIVKTLEVMDTVGEYTQEGLSFVPGVGWVTAAALGTARGAANAYRDGKSGSEIATAALTNGAASALVGRFSPGNANAAFSTARGATNLARNAASAAVRERAAQVAARAAGRYVGTKAAEYGTEKVLGATLNALAQDVGVKNRAAAPRYTPTTKYNLAEPNYSGTIDPTAGPQR